MKAIKLGTILPTKAVLEAGDKAADANKASDLALGNATFNSKPVQRQGEWCWFLSPTTYAIVAKGKVRKFDIRSDGDYSLKS